MRKKILLGNGKMGHLFLMEWFMHKIKSIAITKGFTRGAK
jgi:hypothetical protein